MNTKYIQLRDIHDLAVKANDAEMLREIPQLLNSWGFRCRDKDGQLLWTNLSVPTSIGETITIGLRYMKEDRTLTEDIFEVSSSSPDSVNAYYKGKYQRVRPEYTGTHKEHKVKTESFISVNSCSLYLGSDNGS